MIEPKIIYVDKRFLAIDKPAALMVHAARISSKRRVDEEKRAEPTLVDWLLKNYPEVKTVGDDPVLRPGIVHRLDKDTSGVMLVARDQHTFAYLKEQFQKHLVKKIYLALVTGIPKKKSGVIDAPIGIKNGTLKRSIHSKKMAKEAVTEYRVIKKFAGEGSGKTSGNGSASRALLEVRPRTGRTHQIRVHLGSIGHPILGDRLYGQKKQEGRLMLHARSIEFTDEDGKRFTFEADIPASFGDTR